MSFVTRHAFLFMMHANVNFILNVAEGDAVWE